MTVLTSRASGPSGTPAAAAGTPGPLRPRRLWPASTPRRLWVLFSLVVGTMLLALAAALVLLMLGHATITAASVRADQVVDAADAHAALVDADRTAVRSFLGGEAGLGGPGQQFQDDITTADKDLERIAERDAGDAGGSQQLQAIDAQLVTYSGLVEQADATYRAEAAAPGATRGDLADAYLSYASELVHNPGSGLLATVDAVGSENDAVFADEQSSASVDPVLLVVYLAMALLALVVLGTVHGFLRRHFNRTLSPWLLAAAGALVGMSVWVSVAALHADHEFQAAQGQFHTATLDERDRSLALDADGQASLGSLELVPCSGSGAGKCAATVVAAAASFADGARSDAAGLAGQASAAPLVASVTTWTGDIAGGNGQAAAAAAQNDDQVNGLASAWISATKNAQAALHQQMGTAESASTAEVGVPVLAVIVVVLAFLGFRPRIAEYLS